MKASESIKTISQSLVKAQKEMSAAKKGSANPFFKSKYADYNSVLEACKDALNNQGIVILQPHKTIVEGESQIAFVETVLLHESGEFVSSETKIEVAKKNDPQALGSAISYARRYGLQSLVSLPTSDDDDGEKAMSRSKASDFKKKEEKKEDKPKEEKRTRFKSAKPAGTL